MFVIDFDDTLFDTKTGFKQARLKALEKIGVTEEQYTEAYKQCRTRGDQTIYSSQRHARVLAQYGFSVQKVLDILHKTQEPDSLKKFLYDDAEEFLQNLKSFNQPMILLSLGDPEFQYIKVKGLDLEKYFDRIFMTQSGKGEVMKELLEHVADEPVWFINDKIKETLAVYEEFPQIRPILKQSPAYSEEEYKQSGLPYFSTLTQIYEYIRNTR